MTPEETAAAFLARERRFRFWRRFAPPSLLKGPLRVLVVAFATDAAVFAPLADVCAQASVCGAVCLWLWGYGRRRGLLEWEERDG